MAPFSLLKATQENALFSGLPESAKRRLLAQAGADVFAPREYLFRQGGGVDLVYIVCSGKVREYRESPAGHAFTIETHQAGDVFCKAALFIEDACHRTHAIAESRTQVVTLPAALLREVLRTEEVLAERLLASLAQYAFMQQREDMDPPVRVGSFFGKLRGIKQRLRSSAVNDRFDGVLDIYVPVQKT